MMRFNVWTNQILLTHQSIFSLFIVLITEFKLPTGVRSNFFEHRICLIFSDTLFFMFFLFLNNYFTELN